MIFQGSELICAICEKTFPRKDMIFSARNNIVICENCIRNWRLDGGVCFVCQEFVNRNQPWAYFKGKKTFGHLKCGGIEIRLSEFYVKATSVDKMVSTWALFGKESIGNIALNYCEFRITNDPSKPEDEGKYKMGNQVLCQAGGNFLLGIVGKDTEKIIHICQSCDIPVSMAKGPPLCLHLIPFRVFNNDEAQSYYACQWFFSFDPKGVHKSRESQCEGNCLFWFPRPKNKPRLFDTKCEKFLKMFLEAEPRRGFFPPEPDHKRPWWKKWLNGLFWSQD